jgi:hypothetical protein
MGIKKIIGVAAVLLGITLFVPTPAHANMVLPLFLIIPFSVVARPVVFLAALGLVTAIESIAACWVLGGSIWHTLWVVSVANLASTAFGIVGIPLIFGILMISYHPAALILFLLSGANMALLSLNMALALIVIAIIAAIGPGWAAFKRIYLADGAPRYDTRWKRVLAVTLFTPFLLTTINNGEEDDGAEDWMAPVLILTCLVPFFFASWYIESIVAVAMVEGYRFSAGLVEHALLVANLISYGSITLLVALWLVMELWRITWKDLLSAKRAKRKFAARFYGYKTFSEKPARPRISKTYEPVSDMGRGMDALVEVESSVAMNLKFSSEEQLQKQEQAKSGNESAEGSKESPWAA